MIGDLIEWSARNVVVVLIGTAFLALTGFYAVWNTPLDAMTDFSVTHVIYYLELFVHGHECV